MKKILLTFILAIAITTSFAQYYSAQSPWSFTIIGGASVNYFQVKSATTPVSNSPAAVGCAGVGVDYKMNDFFSISPALMLSGKGGQVDRLDGPTTADVSSSLQYELYYLQAAFACTGHIPVGEQANVFLGAGPYYAKGLFGKSKTDVDDNGQSVKFGTNGDFKSNDYGITSQIGFQTEKGIIIGLNFDLGLSNINQPNPNDVKTNDQFKTRGFYVSVGRSF
jgi:hypothetical protein